MKQRYYWLLSRFGRKRIIAYLLVIMVVAAGIFYLHGRKSVSPSEVVSLTLSARPGEEETPGVSDSAEVKEEAISVNSSAAEKTICLDPGHGGIDPGAMKGKVWEREINLVVAKKVKLLLEKSGHKVYLTRTTNDESLSKQDRASFCNSKNASILVSVHHNTYDDGSVNYTTALYYTQYDQLLAESISQSVSSALKLENKGIAFFNNSVLSKSKMPAAMSEAFFITNSTDYAKLAKADYSRLDKEAAGIVQGIENYFTDPNQFKPTFASEELQIDRKDW